MKVVAKYNSILLANKKREFEQLLAAVEHLHEDAKALVKVVAKYDTYKDHFTPATAREIQLHSLDDNSFFCNLSTSYDHLGGKSNNGSKEAH